MEIIKRKKEKRKEVEKNGRLKPNRITTPKTSNWST